MSGGGVAMSSVVCGRCLVSMVDDDDGPTTVWGFAGRAAERGVWSQRCPKCDARAWAVQQDRERSRDYCDTAMGVVEVDAVEPGTQPEYESPLTWAEVRAVRAALVELRAAGVLK